MLKLVVPFLSLLVVVSAVSYEGYKVYEVRPKNEDHNNILRQLQGNPNFVFWTALNTVNNPVSIIAAPDVQDGFTSLLESSKIEYKVVVEDLRSVIEDERQYHATRSKSGRGITFDRYYKLDEIYEYLEELAEDYPNLVTVGTAGLSYQGREIKYIRISNNTNNRSNPAILIDAGIHAREWIAPATALYIINQVLENSTNSNLIRNVDWIILPSINPDGYNYTWTNDRLWRKTRTPHGACFGVDGNRNFDFHWSEAGASSKTCADDYEGPTVFSENSTCVVRDFILKSVANQTVPLYVSFHSYGPYILYSWGHDPKAYPENAEELDDVARSAANAIKSFSGSRYTVGQSAATLYVTSGNSVDWSKATANISLSYTIELNSFNFGFEVPAANISRIVVEAFEGVKALHSYVQTNYANN